MKWKTESQDGVSHPGEAAGLQTARPRVLISEPGAPDQVFLPYVSSILKSYWERHGSQPGALEWLEPLWLRTDAEGDLNALYVSAPDILGLSCYTWNWDIQLKVAAWAKHLNPNCLVVAGGPDPDYKDPEFFKKYPSIDIVVVKDGEIPFTGILDAYLSGDRSFTHVPGLYMPSESAPFRLLADSVSAHRYTGPAQVPTTFDYSPYLDQASMYERLMMAHPNLWTNAVLETNRGCPYSCSYCDWGSATMQKIRQFAMDRVGAEIEWLARTGVKFIFLADANFGILPRDVEIAGHLADARATHSHPKGLYYCSAKNNPERTVEIARLTYEAGLTNDHVLALQHTDKEVLAGTARSNISPARYREVVAKLSEVGIPSEAQMILGIPGDTAEKWKACLAELMTWGVHDNFQVSPYALLPNAPAAEWHFQEKWQMRTVDRRLVPYGGIREKNGESFTMSKIVVGSKNLSLDDWVEISTYTAFVRALHNRALTRLPAVYLHFVHGVPYREYYRAVIEEFCRNSPLMAPFYQRVRTVYRELLDQADATDAMELEDFPDSSFLVDPCKWLYVGIALRADEFYAALSAFLIHQFPQAKSLKSAIAYQKQLLITPDFSSEPGLAFPIDRDWPAFFKATRVLREHQQLDEPRRFLVPRRAELAVEDRNGRMNSHQFGNGTPRERSERWLTQTIRQTNAAQFCNHSDPQITSLGSYCLRSFGWLKPLQHRPEPSL